MLRIKDLAFIGYPVTDVTRARSFYEGVLGLSSTLVCAQAGRHWIEYPVGGTTLAITNLDASRWRPAGDGPRVAVEVADFEAAVRVLRRAGVRFSLEPCDRNGCRMAIVHDPDGNSLTVHHHQDS